MRIKKFAKYEMLLVEWDDIYSDPAWRSDANTVDTAKVLTIGFYLDNKGRKLRIAHSLCSDGDSDVTVIPFGCVSKIDKLKVNTDGGGV